MSETSEPVVKFVKKARRTNLRKRNLEQDSATNDNSPSAVTAPIRKKQKFALNVEEVEEEEEEEEKEEEIHRYKTSGTAATLHNTVTDATRQETSIVAGPTKSTAARMSSWFDYQPDICKDYKETGYCSYGDSCKFMHDRTDYKSGWQLEKEWNEEQKKPKAKQAFDEDLGEYFIGDDEEDFPFACHMCRQPFTKPVETKCHHFFCEKCALKRYASGKTKCAICGEQTRGLFNINEKLNRKIAESLQQNDSDSSDSSD